MVRYAGAGGAGTALAIRAVQEAELTATPTLLVLDDVDVLGQEVVALLDGSMAAVERRPVMVVATFREAVGEPALASLVERADGRGDAHRGLPPLGASAVEEVARLYTGADVVDLPLESVLRASRGVPARVHEVVSDWARSEASRRLQAAAEYLAAGKTKRSGDLVFANNVIALKLGACTRWRGSPVVGLSSAHTRASTRSTRRTHATSSVGNGSWRARGQDGGDRAPRGDRRLG